MVVAKLPQSSLPRHENKPVSIAVMGATGSGKSTFINLISGSKLAVSGRPESCTQYVQTANCSLEGREITLVDTPGFDDTNRSEIEILEEISKFLTKCYTAGSTLHGIIYLHRIIDNRVGGASRRSFRLFRKLCGDSTLKNVVIVTNMWEKIPTEEGEPREQELKTDDRYFKYALDEGAQMTRHDGSILSARQIISRIFNHHPRPLLIQKELITDGKQPEETSVGREIHSGLTDLARELQEDMKLAKADIEREMQENDRKTKAEMAESLRMLYATLTRVEEQVSRLKAQIDLQAKKSKKRAFWKFFPTILFH